MLVLFYRLKFQCHLSVYKWRSGTSICSLICALWLCFRLPTFLLLHEILFLDQTSGRQKLPPFTDGRVGNTMGRNPFRRRVNIFHFRQLVVMRNSKCFNIKNFHSLFFKKAAWRWCYSSWVRDEGKENVEVWGALRVISGIASSSPVAAVIDWRFLLLFLLKMVFCYQNCSDLLWKKRKNTDFSFYNA